LGLWVRVRTDRTGRLRFAPSNSRMAVACEVIPDRLQIRYRDAPAPVKSEVAGRWGGPWIWENVSRMYREEGAGKVLRGHLL